MIACIIGLTLSTILMFTGLYCADLEKRLMRAKIYCETCEGAGEGFGHDSRGMEIDDQECPDCDGFGYTCHAEEDEAS